MGDIFNNFSSFSNLVNKNLLVNDCNPFIISIDDNDKSCFISSLDIGCSFWLIFNNISFSTSDHLIHIESNRVLKSSVKIKLFSLINSITSPWKTSLIKILIYCKYLGLLSYKLIKFNQFYSFFNPYNQLKNFLNN